MSPFASVSCFKYLILGILSWASYFGYPKTEHFLSPGIDRHVGIAAAESQHHPQLRAALPLRRPPCRHDLINAKLFKLRRPP